ncbi:hypothetical protein ABT095_03210 [Kitasatospora sp. NPDC002227]|uniref:hypothetical protein n=1 Tax=Kitasatospora sp. NPDC002227 TaxID=3154773 RepID=UPI00331E9668
MVDEQMLVVAVEALADRFRSMPQSRLTGAVPGYASRAAAAHWLAAWLATRALTLAGQAPRPFPAVGDFTVGDQLAVAGHELAAVTDAATLAEALAETARISDLTA